VNIKTLKSTPTCFDHYSDHLQGFLKFLVKVMLHLVGIYMTSITKMDGTMNIKHLKALQHVSIIIQIIFMDFLSSLLKLCCIPLVFI